MGLGLIMDKYLLIAVIVALAVFAPVVYSAIEFGQWLYVNAVYWHDVTLPEPLRHILNQ